MTQEPGPGLIWPGKHDPNGDRARPPRARPSITVEERYPGRRVACRILAGDNLQVLDALLARHAGTVDLVYLDPPFATGSTFDLRVRGTAHKRPTRLRVPAYADRFEAGVGGLLAMLDLRLQQVVELLSPTGSLYVHVDPRASHYVKVLLDELLGPECFQREIVWRIGWISGFKSRARNWIRNHDTILFYTRDPRRFTFNKLHVPHPEGYVRRGPPGKAPGIPVDDVWNAGPAELALEGPASLDSIQIKSFSPEKTGYGTQKNLALLRRIVAASSNPDDLVLDPFAGSGTTVVAARELGRRAIGIDASPTAVAVTRQRLLAAGLESGLQVAHVGTSPGDLPTGRPRVRVTGARRGEVTLSLVDYESSDARVQSLPAHERVHTMLVDWSGAEGPLAVDEHVVRPPGGGEVEFVAGPRSLDAGMEHRIRLKVVDVLGTATTTTVRLVPGGSGLRRV